MGISRSVLKKYALRAAISCCAGAAPFGAEAGEAVPALRNPPSAKTAAVRDTVAEPFVNYVAPPVYPGGAEQLHEDFARLTALELVRRTEREVRRNRREAFPEQGFPLSGITEAEANALREESGGWLSPAELATGRPVLLLTISEWGEVSEVHVLHASSPRLDEAVCAAAKRLGPWMPGRRFTDEGWRVLPSRYVVALRLNGVRGTTGLREAIAELLQGCEAKGTETETK